MQKIDMQKIDKTQADRPQIPFDQLLRLRHLRKRVESPDAGPAHYAAYLDVYADVNPKAASTELLRQLDKWPNNPGLLFLQLKLAQRVGDRRVVRELVEKIERSDVPTPYWFERLVRALRSGQLSLGPLRIAIDDELMDPTVLRTIAVGAYESREAAILAAKLEPTDRILELGAGIGYIALLAKAISPSIRYRGCEANAALFPLIEKNKRLNNAAIDIRAEVLGVGEGEVTLYVDKLFCASSLTPVENLLRTDKVVQHDVNSVIRSENANFLVIDIEGGEFSLVPNIDLSHIDKVLIETHPSKADAAALSALYGAFFKAGLLLDGAISNNEVLFFERARAA